MKSALKVTFVWFSDETWNGYTKIGMAFPKYMAKLDDIEIVGRKNFDVNISIVPATPTVYMVGNRKMIENGMPRRKDIGWMTMYDADPPPPTFVEVINRSGFMITPSQWCVDSFRDAGVNVPILKVGYGVDQKEFPFKERNSESKFTVLASGLQMFPTNDRKNPMMTLLAFRQAGLHKVDDAELVIKMATGVKTMRAGDNVRYIYGKLPQDEWTDLMHSADVYAMPTSGEGFGLPPLEAMSTGAATIVTGWSGVTEWLYDSPALKLDVEEFVPATRYNEVFKGDSVWAKPSQDHLTELLRWCYENRDQVKELGQQGAQYVRRKWTWERMARKAADGLHKVYEELWI